MEAYYQSHPKIIRAFLNSIDMNILLKLFFIYFTMLILISCSSEKEKRLAYALSLADKNKTELLKVLAHYKDDAEKYAAACFLIENMSGRYGSVGSYQDSIKAILSKALADKQTVEDCLVVDTEIIEKWNNATKQYGYQYDIQYITANYLIENIDLAFTVWKKYPWNRSLAFNDFCELILPYRIGDEELTNWRKLFYQKYSPILDTYQGSDVVEACNILIAELKKEYLYYNVDFSIPHMGGSYLFENRLGACREGCDIGIYAMRACGIPVATDQYIYSPEYQNSHTWNVVRDTTGMFLPFWFTQFEARRDMKDDGRKKGKVFRDCFGLQKEIYKGITVDKNVPTVFRNRFVKDVTANYTGQNEVTIPITPDKELYVYLGLFSPNGWIPVDIARSEQNKVTFQNLESDIFYQPLYSDGTTHRPAGYPFWFTNGEVHLLTPDTTQQTAAILKRKLSLVPNTARYLYRNIIGAKIESSSDNSFSNPELLYQITDTLTSNYNIFIPLKSKRERFVRYVSPKGKPMELADISFFNDTSCSEKIPAQITNRIEPINDLKKIQDGEILSYFVSRDSSCYVTFDLSKPIEIKKIIFSPRNDDNFVWPDDEYELFYQNGINGWRSLGRKTAETRELHYQVPQNALLWLRNLTKGKEEQVFIWENSKQIFTFDLKRVD